MKLYVLCTLSLVCFSLKSCSSAQDLIQQYAKSIEQNPADYIAHFNMAGQLYKAHDLAGAEKQYRISIELVPTSPTAHYNLGVILAAEGHSQEALNEFRQALTYDPCCSNAHLKIIEQLEKNNKHQEALQECLLAIDYDPKTFEYKMAQLHFAQGNLDEAIIHFRKALMYNVKSAQLLMEYANTLNLHNCPEMAYETYIQICELNIKSISVLYNIAYTLKKLEKFPEAIALCKEVIALSPSHAQAHFTLGTAYLAIGNYTQGWQEYEWRWKQGTLHDRIFKQPLWDGSDLTGKTIYIHAEQGLGDTFQFIRYAQELKKRGARIIAAVQTPLKQIIAQCPYIDEVIELKTVPHQFDTHAALLTLPYILNTQEDTIPKNIPYLFADEHLINYWHNKLHDDTHFKIGICWQGNPNYSTHYLRLAVAGKSMRPALFAPIGQLPGVSIYSMQKDHAKNVDETLPEGFAVKTFDESFDRDHGRFMDTAAVMKNFDLIITVDTSIAHLAGGLGVPVWVVLPKVADWRWLLARSDSPWYPTMRLFRQQVTDNWVTVIDEIVQALKPLIGKHHDNL